ncbi:MAG: hypothetical protein ACXWRE_04755 [Pseudobdellovibrionaceae bacterium]
MKNIAISAKSFALVQELALCSTSDGKYTVSVSDNRGTGPVRTSSILANVTNSEGTLIARYKAEEFKGMRSISFGRQKYQDVVTKGSAFSLEGPSTNFPHYSLKVELNVGETTGEIIDDNLNCNVFGGIVLQK